MIEAEQAQARIQALERRQRRTQAAVCAIIGLQLTFLLAGWKSADQEPQVLRAKGLVIVDNEGRERILLGAPVSSLSDRVRKGAGSALVFVEADGRDRLLLGENTSCLRDGKAHERERGYALLVHDTKGDERGGFGCFDSGKVVIALDRKSPDSDGVGMMVDDSLDYAGLAVNHKMKDGSYVQAISVGVQKGSCYFSMDDPSGHRRMSFELPPEGDARLRLFDAAGKLQRDALQTK